MLQMEASAAAEEGARGSQDPSPGPSPASRALSRTGLLQDSPVALEAFERLEGSPAADRGPPEASAPTAMGVSLGILHCTARQSVVSHSVYHTSTKSLDSVVSQ